MKIVFDTYSWIEYLEASKNGILIKEYLENNEIITPSIVLLELSYKADLWSWDFNKVLSYIKTKSHIMGFNDEFFLQFGKIYNEARRKVKDIGLADCIILTTAKLNDAKILTGDSHFSKFKEAIVL